MPHVETHIKIRLEDLRALKACKDGLKFYKNFAISISQSRGGLPKSIKIPWSPYSMLLALANNEAKQWVRWAIRKGLLPTWSLAEQNLSRADLGGAYLNGADLGGAYLNGADLGGAYLNAANLSGAYLSGADLGGAYLNGADLRCANLIGANLSGADLSGAYYPTGDVPEGWQRVNDRLQRAA